MRILLPRASKGFKFDLLFTIDMNDFDVEMLLPSLFHLIRTKGRRVGTPINPELYGEYFQRMTQHLRLQGFGSHEAKALLDRWVRTSVVRMGKRGRARKGGEQMMYLFPTTMLSYKAGLPKEITRLRGVHNFVYTVLLSSQEDAVGLDRLFRQALGEGLILDDSQNFDGRYDGTSDIDIEAMLTICFLDGLLPAGVSALASEKSVPRLDAQSRYFSHDVLSTLKCYQKDLPTLVLTRFLLSIINFNLFVYSMRLMCWVIGIGGGNDASTNPEFFLNCTGERASYADELARACVERDLETLERYVRSSLRLRTLDRFVTLSPGLRAGLPDRERNTGEYLSRLLGLASDVRVQAKAEQEFEQICAENGLTMNEESEEREITEAAAYLRRLRESDLDPLDRLVNVLFESQRKSAIGNLTGWFYSVSGFNRPYGMMSGNSKGARRIARYTLSNELLSTLVHAALADHGLEDNGRLKPAARLPLREFLAWLEKRHGLLVDRPPALDGSAEAVEAARRNLESLKTRLRQIGVFENLSDDFDAQYIQRPAQSWSGVN